MQADNFSNEDRERLERLLSHPESAEYLTEALNKAIISDAKPQVDESKPEVNQEPEPVQSDTVINITRHFMVSGGLLAGVLLLAAAVSTPLRDTFTVCFNPAPVPNTSKCLGVKSYSIDQDHMEKLVAHPSLVVVPEKRGNPALAVGLALFGTAFAGGSGFIAKQALREKTEAIPVNRTNRRTAWTATKIEADKVVKQRHQDLTQGFAIATNTNQHALAAADTLNEFSQIQRLIAALEPQEREMFFQHLALKEQKEIMQQQAQIQAQQQQNPFSGFLGSAPQQALLDSTSVAATNQVITTIDQAKHVGKEIINVLASSIKSKVLVAPTRAGKTTTLYLYYDAVFNFNRNTAIFVIADKRENIHPDIPIKNYAFCSNVSDFEKQGINTLNKVYEIYTDRANLPESERTKIAESHPVRLALVDWFATWEEIKSNESLAKDVLNKLKSIITKGASSGVCVDIDTHSADVSDLGLSGSVRNSLDFFAQAFYKKEPGQGIGKIIDSLKLLPELVARKGIVTDSKDRERIETGFNYLRVELLNRNFDTPIIFTTGGGNMIGIAPYFDRKTLGDLEIDDESEKVAEVALQVEKAEVQERTIESVLPDAIGVIQEYLEAKEGKQATFSQIRNNGKLKVLWKSGAELARTAIALMISEEILEKVDNVDPLLGVTSTSAENQMYKLVG